VDQTLLYTVPHGEAFGLAIAIYFYLTGLSAGSFIISTLAYGFGFTKFKPLGKIGVVIATLLLIAAPMFLLIHSGRPLRAWHLFVYLHGTSPISWGTFLLPIYPLNCLIYGYFMFRGNAKLTKLFGRIGIPLALMVHGYTGFILSFAKAHALWRSSMMPILFLTSAMVSGVAMMILVTIIKDKFFSEEGTASKELMASLGSMLLWILVFDLFLSFSDPGVRLSGEVSDAELGEEGPRQRIGPAHLHVGLARGFPKHLGHLLQRLAPGDLLPFTFAALALATKGAKNPFRIVEGLERLVGPGAGRRKGPGLRVGAHLRHPIAVPKGEDRAAGRARGARRGDGVPVLAKAPAA
jgi:formate-dependent nitrite reductase membrane component NrfD